MKPADAIPLLADKLREEKLILFVGAGLSQGSGLPDWKTLFAPLCKKLNRPYEDDFPAAADELIEKGIYSRNELVEYIVKKIGDINLELNENHRLLKELPFKIIITTNYDNLLEDLYGASKLKRIYIDEEMAYFDPQSGKNQLIYLHGDINHGKHMVISSADYQDYANTHRLMARRLELLLQEYTVLFTGYSAADPNLLAVIDHFRITYREDARRHFIVIPTPPEKKAHQLRRRYGIEPVILNHHRELTAFLQGLVEAYKNPEKEVNIPIEDDNKELITPEAVRNRIEALRREEQERQQRILSGFKPKKPFNVPTEDPHFTGRETEIDLLKKALLQKQAVGVTGLFGMGGIGKTSLAKHVAHMLRREGHFKDGILWHRLEAKTLPDSLDEMADAFGAYFLREMSKPDVKTRYFQSIIQNLDILIVLDNAEYLEKIPPLLDVLRNHPVLITSRRQLGGIAEVIDIDRLDETKAAELFIKTRYREDKEKEVKRIIAGLPDREREALHHICSDLLGGLPLAVTIAASVLRFKQIELPAFAKILDDKRLDLLNDPNNVLKSEAKDKNVRLSFDLSFSQPEIKETTRSVFSVMGIFGGEDFSKDALYEIFKEEKNEEIDEAVAFLTQLSMVQIRENRLYLHPLLRQYALEKLPEFMGDLAYEKLAGYYTDLVENNPQALVYEWQNARFVAGWCLNHSREKDGLNLIVNIDEFLFKAGKWNVREEWLKKGIEIADRIEELSYYYVLNFQLEDLYGRQGKEKERREVIDLLQAYCPKFDHLHKTISWINYKLAVSLLHINLPENAYNLNLKNLKESTFFMDKHDIGAVYKNLGGIFKRSGFFEQALKLYEASLTIFEKFGPRENKAGVIGNIGNIYLDLERYDEAFACYQRYEIETKACKHKVFEFLIYINYFIYYLDTGAQEKAGNYLTKLKFGIEDFGLVITPAVLNYYEGLLEKEKKNYKNAIELFDKAVRFYDDIEKEDENGDCYFNIGVCYLKLDNIRQARENLNAAGEIFKKYESEPVSRCWLEAYLALLEVKSAYDQRAVRLLYRAKNTLRKIGIEDSKEIDEIEAEIRQETGEEKYDTLLKQLKESEDAGETIDLGGDYLFIDPAEREITSPIDNRDMALIPAGFVETEHYDIPLYFYPYYMDKYPVTNRDYKKFVEETGIEPPPHWQAGKIPVEMEDHPVVGITYDETLAYAQWAGKDLPLREEWEVAAGIGDGFSYPWGKEIGNSQDYFKSPISNEEKKKPEKETESFLSTYFTLMLKNLEQKELLNDSSEKIKTCPVQRFEKNRSQFGIYDLLGNVFEYTLSFTELEEGSSFFVIKGFSWLRHAKEGKNDITGMEYSSAHQRWADVGFRCVKRIFRQGEEKEFIETGGRDKDWQGEWYYNRANHLFTGLSSGDFFDDKEKGIEKGIEFCRKTLACSPGHKQAAYLLIRFQFLTDEKKEIDYKYIYDHTLYPLLEKNSESRDFNWRRVEELFPPLKETMAHDNMIGKCDKLKEMTGKIDALLQAVENTLVTAGLRLAERNTITSMDYLLKRHEENLSFFHYVLILFLGSMKIDIANQVVSLEEIAEIGADLITPETAKGKGSIAALKIANLGLAPLNDIVVELAAAKLLLEDEGKTITLEPGEFKIPFLVRGESHVVETTVNALETGTFPLKITLSYSDPKAGEDEEKPQKIIEKQLRVISPGKKTAPQEITLTNPYLTGRPVQSPEMFFGRRDVLERIEKRLSANNIIILYGQRRTGKTSTLFQLKNVVYKDKAIPVFLTMQSMLGSDRSFFFFRMAEGVYDALQNRAKLPKPEIADFKTDPQYKLEQFLKAVLEQEKQRPIIYLIDEFDGLFRMIEDNKMEAAVLDNLRSIMQHFQQVWFLLAGTHLLKQAAADDDSALFNIATYEKISILNEKDAGELITKPVQNQVEYEPYAVEKIKTLTNCHPYFIQGICFELINYLETGKLTRVTAKEVDVVVDEILRKGNTHFDHYWPYLSPEEQLFLSLLAANLREYESSASIDRVREFCKGRFPPRTDIYKLIDRLKEKELINEKKHLDKRHAGFFMDIFKRWVKMYHSPDPAARGASEGPSSHLGA